MISRKRAVHVHGAIPLLAVSPHVSTRYVNDDRLQRRTSNEPME